MHTLAKPVVQELINILAAVVCHLLTLTEAMLLQGAYAGNARRPGVGGALQVGGLCSLRHAAGQAGHREVLLCQA